MREEKQWKSVIEPQNRRIEIRFQDLWKYRDLVWLLVKRDIVAEYKQTILGPIWMIISPVLTTVVFTIVFGKLAKLPTTDVAQSGNMVVPAFLFYMLGNLLWGYFSGTVRAVAHTFVNNAGTMKKVYYPRLISPIASAVKGLVRLAILLAIFVVILIVCALKGIAVVHPTAALLLFPALVLEILLFGLGVGLVISAFTTKYRDVFMIMNFMLRLWLYASPVAYGLQILPAKWVPIFMLNPMASILTAARYLFFGEGFFRLAYFVHGWIVILIILALGVVLFSWKEKTFVDTI